MSSVYPRVLWGQNQNKRLGMAGRQPGLGSGRTFLYLESPWRERPRCKWVAELLEAGGLDVDRRFIVRSE